MEETDWDARYQKNDTPWDKGAPAPAIARLVSDGVFPAGAKILVPGCGTGHDVAKLANLGFETLGLDISQLAITEAEKLYDVPRATFELGDLFDPDWAEDKSFDVVWEHTCYCAIHPSRRGDYVKALHRLLQPGGLLVGVFFTDTQMPEGEGPPYETSRDEVVEMFSPSFSLIAEQAPPAYYPERIDREWLMLWQQV